MNESAYDTNGHLLVSGDKLFITAHPWDLRGWRETDGTVIEEVWKDGRRVKLWVNYVEQEIF